MSRLVLGGFPAFGEDNACIVSASLASADHLDGGTVYAQTGSSAQFAGGGVRFPGGQAGIGWSLTDAQSATLRNGGRITFYVSPNAVDSSRTVAAVEMILATFVGTEMGSGAQSALLRLEPTNSRLSGTNFANANVDTRTNCIGSGKPNPMRIDVTWNYGRLRIYYDYLLGSEYALRPIATLPETVFRQVMLGATAGANPVFVSCNPDAIFANFEISTRPLWLPVARKLEQVIVFGDSFTASQGSYPDNGVGRDWAIEGTQAAPSVMDGGYLPAVHRALARRGLHVGANRVISYGVGGAGVVGGTSQLAAQVTSAIADHRQYFAAVLQIGTNDVNSHVLNTITIDSTWKAAYKAQIDRILERRCERLALANVCSRRAAVSSQTSAYDDATALANQYIAEIASEYSEVALVDQFTRMGGHNVDLADFKPDDNIHPLAPGFTKLGDEVAKMLVSLL